MKAKRFYKFYYNEEELDYDRIQVSWVDWSGEEHFVSLNELVVSLHEK